MINYFKDQICINVLANSIENAKEIYDETKGNVVIGLLSANYNNINEAVEDMNSYAKILKNNISIGLGGGSPSQSKIVTEISKNVNSNHINQVFTDVAATRALCLNNDAHINALVSPSGKVGYVNISTGALSSKAVEHAIVPIETAIMMIKDMGGNAVKFFPMQGLKTQDEYIAVAKACAENDFVIEPTGGIDLNNLEEIIRIAIDCGVKKIIPHIYSSIIDKTTGKTKIEDVKHIMEIINKVIK